MIKDSSLNAGAKFQRFLMNDEHILWAGQPDPNVIFTPYDVFLIPFSLVWGGSVIMSQIQALRQSPPSGSPDPFGLTFQLIGIPFVLVGLYLLIGRFIFKRWRKKHTFYAVTERRLLELNDRTDSLHETYVDSISGTDLKLRKTGTGTIKFSSTTGGFSLFSSANYWANTGMDVFQSQFSGFYDILDARKVNDMIRAQRSNVTLRR